MNDTNKIKYDGSNIITSFINRLTTQITVRLPISGAIFWEEPQSEEEWKGNFIEFPASMLGKGKYFVWLADGDSMIDAELTTKSLICIPKRKI